MERHDAVTEDRREPGEIGDIGDGDAGLGDHPGGTAARNEIPTEIVQRACQIDNTGLVIHGQKGPHWTLPLSMISEMVRT